MGTVRCVCVVGGGGGVKVGDTRLLHGGGEGTPHVGIVGAGVQSRQWGGRDSVARWWQARARAEVSG